MPNLKKEKAMSYQITVRKAGELEAESYVVTPQHPTGLLLVREIVEVEAVDDRKWIEITTEDGLQHLVSPDSLLLEVFNAESK